MSDVTDGAPRSAPHVRCGVNTCIWPDDEGIECGKPVKLEVWQFDLRRGARVVAGAYCKRHVSPKRVRNLQAAGWYTSPAA